MASTPAISVVIAMYNAEKYISECLGSILAQTFQNFEVILVNDCSTDNSRQIAESYIEKFNGRLKIYDNEKNFGASVTRNNGLLKASGEYVFFMDADDLILANGLEKLYKVAKYFDVDVINITKSYDLSEDGTSLSFAHLKLTRRTNEPMLESNLEWRVKAFLENQITTCAPWRKLSRRNFLIGNKIFFPENLRIYEDQIWTIGLFLSAKKIIHMPIAVYFYRKSDNSLSKQKDFTSLQKVNILVNGILQGLNWLDNIIVKIPFFAANPQQHYAILDYAVQRFFTMIYKSNFELSPLDMYLSIKQEFGKDFGKYATSLSALFTVIYDYKKNIDKLEKRIAGLEKKFKSA